MVELKKSEYVQKSIVPRFERTISGKTTTFINKNDFAFLKERVKLTSFNPGTIVNDFEKENIENEDTYMILTSISAASGIVQARAANRKLIESTVKLATNSAASKLAEYHSAEARAELQAYREQLDNERTTRIRSMFEALNYSSRNDKNQPTLGGYVLLRSALAAAPDSSVADEDFEVVHLITDDGSRKRQKVTAGGNVRSEQLERFKIISGEFENGSKAQMLSADLPFSLYPIPRTSQIDTNDPNVRAGLVNLKLQLSLTNQKTLGSLETPQYEFSAHYCDLDHHKREAKNAARIAAAAIFGTHRCKSMAELGSSLVNIHLNEELPTSDDLLEYVNGDHIQPNNESESPCGWKLWPKLQENHAGASINIERYLFDLDPFRVLDKLQAEQVNKFETAFDKELNSLLGFKPPLSPSSSTPTLLTPKTEPPPKNIPYIVLTGTDKDVPPNYELDRVITLTENDSSWCLGKTASSFGTAIMAAAALLQDELDNNDIEPEDGLVGNRMLEEDDYLKDPDTFKDSFKPSGSWARTRMRRQEHEDGIKEFNYVDIKQQGNKVIQGDDLSVTDKSLWKINEIQRMNKNAGLKHSDGTNPVKNWESTGTMAPRPFAWKHNQRLKSACTLPGKIKKIYGQSRLMANTDIFATTSLHQTKIRGQIHYESAEKCIPLRDIGAYDSNLFLGPDTGQDLPCTSVIIKVDPEDLGKKMARSFQGWHYSSTNALGRTTHAIVPLSARFQTVVEHLKNFSTNEKSSRDEYNFYKDLQTVMSQHNRSQPNLIENAHLVVKGPSEESIATLCVVNGYVRPTPKYYVIVREICGHLDDLIEAAAGGRDWLPMKKGGKEFFWEKYKEKRNGLIQGHQFFTTVKQIFNDPILASSECIQIISLAYTQIVVRADGGTHQKHLLGANEAMHALLTCCRRLLLRELQAK